MEAKALRIENFPTMFVKWETIFAKALIIYSNKSEAGDAFNGRYK